jgi:hypothetical protein
MGLYQARKSARGELADNAPFLGTVAAVSLLGLSGFDTIGALN